MAKRDTLKAMHNLSLLSLEYGTNDDIRPLVFQPFWVEAE